MMLIPSGLVPFSRIVLHEPHVVLGHHGYGKGRTVTERNDPGRYRGFAEKRKRLRVVRRGRSDRPCAPSKSGNIPMTIIYCPLMGVLTENFLVGGE